MKFFVSSSLFLEQWNFVARENRAHHPVLALKMRVRAKGDIYIYGLYHLRGCFFSAVKLLIGDSLLLLRSKVVKVLQEI